MNEQFMTYGEYRAMRRTGLQRFLSGAAVAFVWLVALATIALIVERLGAI